MNEDNSFSLPDAAAVLTIVNNLRQLKPQQQASQDSSQNRPSAIGTAGKDINFVQPVRISTGTAAQVSDVISGQKQYLRHIKGGYIGKVSGASRNFQAIVKRYNTTYPISDDNSGGKVVKNGVIYLEQLDTLQMDIESGSDNAVFAGWLSVEDIFIPV